jgi:nitrite reductase/ring-hydroxylating ferredoxin subunit
MTHPDRAPKERYFDPEFYRLETERLWSRTWQMGCRLEEIPQPNDFTEYEILDQPIVIVRTDDGGARAFQNACRHRGVKVAQGRGSCPAGFVCPFHGWCYGPDGKNTAVTQRRTFSEHNLDPADLDLVPVRCETWGGCAWVNLDDAAPPLRDCIEPFATAMDAWQLESMRAEWWYACRLPVNWKIAEEAFQEQYHVLESHPQLRIPGRMFPRPGKPFDPNAWLDGELQYLKTMSDGMAGMVHVKDVRIAEDLRAGIVLPEDPKEAAALWQRSLNDAVVGWHRVEGAVIPDLNALAEQGMGDSMYYCFPHFFVLPMYSSASSYRFRPLGPEETLMEIWSLTRYPAGSEPSVPPVPEVWEHDDPRWPPIPAQDFSNLPRQQKGLHAKGFEYMRLSAGAEGGICNFERLIDGFLAGLSYDALAAGLRAVNVNPLESPVADLGF